MFQQNRGNYRRSSQAAADSDAVFRCDRFMIVLRPCATRHKFRLYTGFTAVRLLGVPYEIAYRRWKRTHAAKKNTRSAALCIGIHGCPEYAPSI